MTRTDQGFAHTVNDQRKDASSSAAAPTEHLLNVPRPVPALATTAAVLMRFALILALFGVGWNLYRRLPGGEAGTFSSAGQPDETTLRIIMRPASSGPELLGGTSAQLFPIDVTAALREYSSRQRPETRQDDFLMQRMGKRQPLTARFDERGEATISVPPGKWWVHAILPGAKEELTWYLPVSVSGRERVVELTSENAYTRAKSF